MLLNIRSAELVRK